MKAGDLASRSGFLAFLSVFFLLKKNNTLEKNRLFVKSDIRGNVGRKEFCKQ